MSMKDGLHGTVGAHSCGTAGLSTAALLAAANASFIMPKLWSPLVTQAKTTSAKR